MIYDTIIIGSGPAGMFAAHELSKEGLAVLIIDRGFDIEERKKNPKEIQGIGGAGSFSDGKLTLSCLDEVGGSLTELLGYEAVESCVNYVDSIFVKHGGEGRVFEPDKDYFIDLRKNSIKHGLKLLCNKIRHMGTDGIIKATESLRDELLKNNVNFLFKYEVIDVESMGGLFNIYAKDLNGENHLVRQTRHVIMATGRSGAKELGQIATKRNIRLSNILPVLDVGVRIECPMEIISHLTEQMHEAKFIYYSKNENKTRSFCMAPKGFVSIERHSNGNNDSFYVVNGYSNRQKAESSNCNFAVLTSQVLTKPFNDPYEYGKQICRLTNLLAGGKNVIMQRTLDLQLGRRSTTNRINRLSFKPTLEGAEAGNIALAIPKIFVDEISNFMTALSNIIPGLVNDSLMYAPEVKFYSTRFDLTNELESNIPNLFICGDGSGLCRGISQSAASGVIAATAIKRRILQNGRM